MRSNRDKLKCIGLKAVANEKLIYGCKKQIVFNNK